MEQALAYVCCSAEESRVKVQKYCRKIYELGYVPICPRFGFSPFLEGWFFVSMDSGLLTLYKENRITAETALEYAANPEMLKRKM